MLLAVAVPLHAQSAGQTLSGTVKGPAGPLPNVTVTVANVATGQTMQAQTDALGSYTVSNLTDGNYQVSVTASGFRTEVITVSVGPGAGRTVDLTLSPASPEGLSLQDLGISSAEAAGSAQEQARLDRRSHMLMLHQRLGLVTAAPMLASILTSSGAKLDRRSPAATSPTGREIHGILGAATAGMYLTTAYFAIRAPKIPGTETHGHIRLHKALAWIHGPGMVLTPTLGAIAYYQESHGQRVHGIASMHGQVGIVTFGAFTAAMLSVSIK